MQPSFCTTPRNLEFQKAFEGVRRGILLATKQPIQLFTNGLVAQLSEVLEMRV
jgi:hypothetical protein